MKTLLSTLGALALLGTATVQAADTPADIDKSLSNQIECRPVVLIGGSLQGMVVCRTQKEWAQLERAARVVFV